MDGDCRFAWILAAAFAFLAGGCDSYSFDRVPEVEAASAAPQDGTSAGQRAHADGDGIAPRTTESVEDAALSSKVEAALGAEPDLHGSPIAVRSQQGVVTLSGTTPDPRLRSMAAQVALSIDGVERVRNEIVLAQPT